MPLPRAPSESARTVAGCSNTTVVLLLEKEKRARYTRTKRETSKKRVEDFVATTRHGSLTLVGFVGRPTRGP